MMGSHIDTPEDFVQFPWEKTQMSDEEMEKLLKMVDEAKEYNDFNSTKL